MTAAEAIKLAEEAFGAAGLPVDISAAENVLRVQSKTHEASCAFCHNEDGRSDLDDMLRAQMIPQAVASMARMITGGNAPLRPTV